MYDSYGKKEKGSSYYGNYHFERGGFFCVVN